MSRKKYESLHECLDDLKSGILNKKSFIMKIKFSEALVNEALKKTSFLDEYENVDINERLYCIINGIESVVKCKYCDMKATFERINTGYLNTCSSKECKFKMNSDMRTGKTLISENRTIKFKEWEKSIKEKSQLNDEVIEKNISSERLLNLVENEIIIDFLMNRYTDSESVWESWHRITHTKLEKKDICAKPGCGKPVKYVGRQDIICRDHCSESCAAYMRVHNKREN